MDEKQALTTWIAHGHLTREQMESLFGRLMDGEISDVYKAALLAATMCPSDSVVNGAPRQSVMMPPAFSTTGTRAAKSYNCNCDSTIRSTWPDASRPKA